MQAVCDLHVCDKAKPYVEIGPASYEAFSWVDAFLWPNTYMEILKTIDGYASFLSSYIAILPLVSPMYVLGLFADPAEHWYRQGQILLGRREFLVMDPDGYLLRFAQSLGERPL